MVVFGYCHDVCILLHILDGSLEAGHFLVLVLDVWNLVGPSLGFLHWNNERK